VHNLTRPKFRGTIERGADMESIRIDEQYISSTRGMEITRNVFYYSDEGVLKYTLKRPADFSNGTFYKYNDDGLIVLAEEIKNKKMVSYTKYVFETDSNGKNILKEMVVYSANGDLKDIYSHVYENNVRIKTLHKHVKDNIEYEYIHQYEDGVKRGVVYPGGKIHTLRQYNPDGSLKAIYNSSGEKVVFIWQGGITNYDYNVYYIS
jgi:hypothetical protein